jgi:putative glutathione S-transferase
LAGSRLTEADCRLLTTLVRFDFKWNLRRVVDYPSLWNYAGELLPVPGVPKSVNLFHIKRRYYASYVTIKSHKDLRKRSDFSTLDNRARLAV